METKTLRDEAVDELSSKIYQVLNGHKLLHHTIKGTDSALPLVDYLTPDGERSIALGVEETEALTEAITEALCQN